MRKALLEFLQSTGQLDLQTILLRMAVATLVGFLIYLSYMISHEGSIYSRKFNVSLMALTVITTAVMIVIGNNITLSLGMVGALSIVRFRTAVKDPMDLAFLFWTISVGIICGAGLFEVAVEASILITIVMLLLHFVPNVKPALLLLVNGTDSKIQAELEQVLKDGTRFYKIKSRNMTGTGIDMIVELKTKDEGALIEKVLAIPAVESATLMTHDGEITY